jgi:hypothetical protein
MSDSSSFGGVISGLVVGVITVAIVAVVLSRNANTAGVIGASGSGLASVIGAAVSPITGGASSTALPSSLLSSSTFGAAFN